MALGPLAQGIPKGDARSGDNSDDDPGGLGNNDKRGDCRRACCCVPIARGEDLSGGLQAVVSGRFLGLFPGFCGLGHAIGQGLHPDLGLFGHRIHIGLHPWVGFAFLVDGFVAHERAQ